MVDRLRGPARGLQNHTFLWQHSRNTFRRVCESFVCIHRPSTRRGSQIHPEAHNQLPALISLTLTHNIRAIHLHLRPPKPKSISSPRTLSRKSQKPPPEPPHGRIVLFARRCRWNFALSITNSHSPCRPSLSFQATTALAFEITIKRSSFSSSHLKVNISIT